MPSIQEIWGELEDWLKSNLPHNHASLRPGASEEQITQIERELGFRLPEDWKTLYQIHDGQDETDTAMLTLRWLPLADVLSSWRMWKELLADGSTQEALSPDCKSIPPGAIQEKYINLGWLPMFTDGGGNAIGPDLQPGANGQIGQMINFGRDELEKFVIAPDLKDFLQWIVSGIRSGKITLQKASTGADVIRFIDPPNESIFTVIHQRFGI